jgi:hypothetical protein
MSNIGRIIQNHFCNGYFDRSHNYDLGGAVIIAEDDDWVVVRQEDGKPAFASFDDPTEKQTMIDQWCSL